MHNDIIDDLLISTRVV